MIELHFPWLETAILVPLLGALWSTLHRDPATARRSSLMFAGLTLLLSIGAWGDFASLHIFEAHDRWDYLSLLVGDEVLVVDELSAPLLPLVALLYLLTIVTTARTQERRFSFTGALVSEAVLLATLSCKHPVGVSGLLILGTLWPLWELRRRGKPMRVYMLHMGLFSALLILGGAIVAFEGSAQRHSMWGVGLLSIAVLIRSGIAPFHCWVTDLFEHASFGTALLFVTPMAGAYAAVRLVMPIAPDGVLRMIAVAAVSTAVYAAGMAFVQTEARRFFCYLFLSHSALVLVGLEIATPVALAGGLCVWLSVTLALSGFGLALRSVEARTGRLSLAEYHGLYDRVPTLAAFVLLTGLASVGFPGTFGFVGTELLVDGLVHVYPAIGVAVVFAAAINGIAVMRVYFRIFTAVHHPTCISLQGRRPERLAVLVLSGLILGGGLFPQAGISSRYHAATELIRIRDAGRQSSASLRRSASPVTITGEFHANH